MSRSSRPARRSTNMRFHGAPLPRGDSLMLLWPQLTALLASVIPLFGIA